MKNTLSLFPEDGMISHNHQISYDDLVSVSQIQQFMSCRKRWEYGYLRGLAPRVERPYLTIGRLCHTGMQASMNAKWGAQQAGNEISTDRLVEVGRRAIADEFNSYMGRIDFLDEELPSLDQIPQDAAEVFSRALRDFDPARYRVETVWRDDRPIPATEVHFIKPIPTCEHTCIHGFIDAILTDLQEGGTWCFDYKFRSQLSPDDDEQFNIQNAVYMDACAAMGIDVAGSCTWQHLNIVSTRPSTTKSGMSRVKIRCTWDVYEQCLIAAGIDPEGYEDMREKLAQVEWTRATREIRSAKFLREVLHECVYPMAESIESIRDRMAMGHAGRSLDPWNCKRCQFQSLCQAELRGYDVDDVIAREYTRRDRQ